MRVSGSRERLEDHLRRLRRLHIAWNAVLVNLGAECRRLESSRPDRVQVPGGARVGDSWDMSLGLSHVTLLGSRKRPGTDGLPSGATDGATLAIRLVERR